MSKTIQLALLTIVVGLLFSCALATAGIIHEKRHVGNLSSRRLIKRMPAFSTASRQFGKVSKTIKATATQAATSLEKAADTGSSKGHPPGGAAEAPSQPGTYWTTTTYLGDKKTRPGSLSLWDPEGKENEQVDT
ncbi:hypothetical protein PGT21_007745 [Puccinia graminis f. sp. tritici]|uniref:Uncharacterized protein n=2 Tax=Puccinia graminis f. sp. tritici TaxID=56615 RepID=E3L0F3_PUCGT|nr:uncharacterized protein PGTG_15899 [Puccinia graminis f. sp. tritici CRL 75-36-700-3]EFP90051.1 hypothetical protein PGTG_15899 [Puccinia graminis f. sp. tritici CRL 75-36-700-3]KAA1112731.1 hypothetical protein PGT21_007745 [Puccinia graminis f. sp. tritici]